MIKINPKPIAYCFLIIVTFSCQVKKSNKKNTHEYTQNSFLPFANRFDHLINFTVNSKAIPRGIDKDFKVLKTTPASTWTSGFYAGNLWYIYQLTNQKAAREKAIAWTWAVKDEQFNDSDHDIGFKIYNSFGLAYKNTQETAYKEVIVNSANTLLKRYDPNIKAIQSWDAKKNVWDYPVIIDNMMNLELLFEASLLSKNQAFYNIAVNHANTTLQNHFREDNSTYHVVDYLPNGTVKAKKTHQGYNDQSAWARGQAWAVYGFTMTYRYTKNKKYLEQAQKTAAFYLNHPKLPTDGIPYWDFDDPQLPHVPKDVSAATIMASAFFELYDYTKNNDYLNYANKVLETLKKPEYLIDNTIKTPFILTRSTGNFNKNSEIDCPIVYADYYLLEALVRKQTF